MTRIAACWRSGERYVLRDVDGRAITEAEGRAICAERYTIPPGVRAVRRRSSDAKVLKERTSRRKEESTKAAPGDRLAQHRRYFESGMRGLDSA